VHLRSIARTEIRTAKEKLGDSQRFLLTPVREAPPAQPAAQPGTR
jgi:hypothetical protein